MTPDRTVALEPSPAAAGDLITDRARLDALARADLLDTPSEPGFDRLTALVQRVLGVPVAVVSLVARANDGDTSLAAFSGCARRRPAIALALTVLLLAQAGVPLTSGFVAKFGVIQAAVDEESYAIAIIAMVSAVIAAFLYLRIMVSMWLEPGSDEPVNGAPTLAPYTSIAVFLAAAFTLAVGVWPDWILDAAEHVAAYAR